MERKTMKVKTNRGYQVVEVSFTKEGAKHLNRIVNKDVKQDASKKSLTRS